MDTVTDKNTVAEIKAYLDAQGIAYPYSASKADLLALVPALAPLDDEEPVEGDDETGEDGSSSEEEPTEPEQPAEPIKVSSFDLDKTDITVEVGKEAKVKMTNILPEDAEDKTIVATSNDNEIATVLVHTDGSIGIQGVAAGTVKAPVKSNDGGATKELTITVKEPVVPVTDFTVSVDKLDGVAGKKSEKLTISNILPKNATNKNFVYSSDDENIAKVASVGSYEYEVTYVGKGSTTIHFATKDGSVVKEVTVDVNDPVISVTDIKMADDNPTAGFVGDDIVLGAIISPEDATNQKIDWQTSDESLAEFTKTGAETGHKILSLLKEGTVEVTATTEDGSKVATQSVKIENKVVKMTDFKIDKSELNGEVGGSDVITVSNIQPENTTDLIIDGVSDDDSIVTVQDNGDGSYSIDYMNSGSTTIQMKSHDGGVTKGIYVVVNEPEPVEPELEPWEYMLINHDSTVYLAPSVDTYTVQAGETLADIATAHMMSLGKLKKLNKLTINVLPAGRVIRLS